MHKIFLAIILVLSATAASASTFWHGTIIGVAYNDVLNLRKWPDAKSRIIGVYNNKDDISMTGRCKNTVTNASFRVDNGKSANWKRVRMDKPNVWCQVVADDGQVGWVRGAFVRAD